MSNKKVVVLEFAAGPRNLEALEAERDASLASQKRQSSTLPATPAPRAQQPTKADFDVDEMVLRARAQRVAADGIAEDASMITCQEPMELKPFKTRTQHLQENDREQERLRAEEKRQAEAREKERREWRHPWFSKTPLIPVEDQFATVRTTPPDDPFHIAPTFNL